MAEKMTSVTLLIECSIDVLENPDQEDVNKALSPSDFSVKSFEIKKSKIESLRDYAFRLCFPLESSKAASAFF